MLVPSPRSPWAQGEGEGTTMSATAIAEEEAGPRLGHTADQAGKEA